MIFLDEVKNMKIYNKPFFLPFNEDNNKLGSAIFLLTPNYLSSKGVMNLPYLINRRYFQSYYMEKNVNYYISSGFVENAEDLNSDNLIGEFYADYLEEASMKAADRNALPDKAFGIPKKRKYPLNDEKHVRSAIRFFNYVDKEDEKELASNIKKAIKKFNMSVDIGEDNRLKDYIKEAVQESFKSDEEYLQKFMDMKEPEVISEDVDIIDEDFKKKAPDASYLTNHLKYMIKKPKTAHNKVSTTDDKVTLATAPNYPTSSSSGGTSSSNPPSMDGDDNGDDSEEKKPNTDETKPTEEAFLNNIRESDYIKTDNSIIFLEDSSNDAYFRRLLYNDRIRQDKQVLTIYDTVKADNAFIKYAYIKLDRYKAKNLFVDLSYYNQSFFKNNTFKLDKGVNLYIDLLDRLVNDKRISSIYKKRTIFIPIKDWSNNPNTNMIMYQDDINPISAMYRVMRTNSAKLKEIFKDTTLVFTTEQRYFKVNFNEVTDFNKFNTTFRNLITKLNTDQEVDAADRDNTSNNTESKKAIVANIVDRLDAAQGINIYKLTGDTKDAGTADSKIKSKDSIVSSDAEAERIIKDQEKRELLAAIDKAAETSTSTDDALEKLDDERIKQIIIDLASEEEENVKINNARSSRMLKLQNDMYDIEINGKTVKELLQVNPEQDESMPVTDLSSNITTINKEEWSNLQYMNFDKNYDINSDIMKMVDKLSKVTYPLAVRNIKVTDNSTSEDYIDLYAIDLEDFRGKRYSVKFDVPKFKNDKFLLLRGNQKTIQNQFFNMPIIKTDDDTCQIISNYNKIFIRRFGTSSGKSYPTADRILKTLGKYNGRGTKVSYADCTKVAARYELPIDYIDLGTTIGTIENDNYIIYFNQTEIRELYKDKINLTEGLPFAKNKSNNSIVYYNGNYGVFSDLLFTMLTVDKTFVELYNTTKEGVRYTYSKASILNTEIPLVIVCAYSEGLENTMKKARINYVLKDKLDKETRSNHSKDYIKFNDGYLVYDLDYNSSLLMNGLKEVDTSSYSLADINNKTTYLDFLDNYGGRIKADGIENFYDCMIDPITEEVLQHYKLPTDYLSVLLHANLLLADNKFIKHTDTSSRRLRRKELIAVKVYKTLYNDAYSEYANQLRHNKNTATYSIKQSAVIDKFMADPTTSDNSIVNAINDVETVNAVTSKGESGMNSDRAYSLDKRTYDESMLNVLAMSTGFAGNVGITRQATIDMNVEGKRGYIKTIDKNTEKMNTVKSLCITEALNPMGATSDYPFRTAMTFIQTAKHSMRTEDSDPLLVTNGSDEAMPYLTSDIFSFKAKFNGTILDYVEDDYIIVEYTNEEKEYINLKETIEKNSDGGFYVPMKLSANDGIRVGKKVKEGDILAYDKESFSNSLGESDNISFDVGTLSKVAIMNTDEGFEDSTIVSEKLCERMASKVIVKEDRMLPKDTNIYNLVKVGQHVEEGDTLLVYQTPYEEEDMNALLKQLTNNEEEISELGRIPIRSHVTGTVAGIKMYRTVEIEELSDSLKKAFNDYERPIKAMKKKLDNEHIISSNLPATYKLPTTGKLKNAQDGVLIEIYVEVYDIMAVGDKIVIDRANKGIIKDIIPTDKHAYTEFRPNEEVAAFASVASFNKRMVTSPLKIGAVNKYLVELDRSVKDILGIPYDDSKI